MRTPGWIANDNDDCGQIDRGSIKLSKGVLNVLMLRISLVNTFVHLSQITKERECSGN